MASEGVVMMWSSGQWKDLCGRRNALTQAECFLADTHYPRPHQSMDGTQWHDGLCPTCLGSSIGSGQGCAVCQGAGFVLVEPEEP